MSIELQIQLPNDTENLVVITKLLQNFKTLKAAKKISTFRSYGENIIPRYSSPSCAKQRKWDLPGYSYPWPHMAAYGQVGIQLSKNKCRIVMLDESDHVE